MFGGFDDWDVEETRKWIIDLLWENYAPSPEKLYVKGDTFRGILFGKFASETDRDRVVEKINTLKQSMYGNKNLGKQRCAD